MVNAAQMLMLEGRGSRTKVHAGGMSLGFGGLRSVRAGLSPGGDVRHGAGTVVVALDQQRVR